MAKDGWKEENQLRQAKRKLRFQMMRRAFGDRYPETVMRALAEEFPVGREIPMEFLEYSCQEVMKILDGRRYYVCLGGDCEEFKLGTVFGGKSVRPLEELVELKVQLMTFNLDEFGDGTALLEQVSLEEMGYPSETWPGLGDLESTSYRSREDDVDSWELVYEYWIRATYNIDYKELGPEYEEQDPMKGFAEQLREIFGRIDEGEKGKEDGA